MTNNQLRKELVTESGIVLADTFIGRPAIADLNNDGFNDIVLTSYRKPIQLYVNDGEGGFIWSEFGNSTDVLGHPVLADLDSDGLLDLVVSNFSPTGVSAQIWFNRTELPCCSNRVGDASAMSDAKFISGSCEGILDCLTEADVNQSGGPRTLFVTISL